ncbi:MAG TPA: hypothetical protein PLB01_03090 [Thermoanaerobaculia bacterium]|nr:hypothetical protein [Thermoanaerobaculia bacterium]
MRLRPAIVFSALMSSALVFAQAAPLREVNGDTLVSPADPVGSFVFDKAFRYAGGQTIDVMKIAGAEQHFFVDAAPDRSIRRFYWIQFEHFHPDNTRTYDFSKIPQKPVSIGRLAFAGDLRVKADYFTMDQRPGSDSKAAEDFLRARGFKLDGTFVTLRLFHLPDDTKRSELMIIYGEALPAGASEERFKAEITAHAQANLKVP